MTDKPIRERLENWGRANRGGFSNGADCMTGLICERLRKAALGDVWQGVQPLAEIDHRDADLIDQAWMRLAVFRHKQILKWFYVRRWNPDFICSRLSIKRFPASIFDIELYRAVNEMQQLLDKNQLRNRIPTNNLIPSEKSVPAQVGGAISEETEGLD